MSVTIVPDSAYVEGILYTIVVTDKVKNQNGRILSKPAKRPFIYFSNSEELKLGWDAKLRMQEIDKATGRFFIQWSIPPVKNIVGYHAYTRLEGHNEDGVTRPILDQNGQKLLIENNSGYFTLNRAIESNKMYGFAVSVVYKDGTESQMSQMNSVIYYNNDKKPPAEDNTSISTIEKAVLDLTNAERKKAGLLPLQADNKLMQSARQKSKDMSINKYLSHQSPTYGSPYDQMKAHGISYKAAGENIAQGYITANEVVIGWMNSSGHRSNMLNSNFTHIGIGFDSNGNYWTQQFIQK